MGSCETGFHRATARDSVGGVSTLLPLTEIMLSQLVSFCCLVSLCSPHPLPQTESPPAANSTTSGSYFDYNNWDLDTISPAVGPVWENMPTAVKKYFIETQEQGEELFNEIYEDLNEEVVNWLEKNIGQFQGLGVSFIDSVTGIVDSTISKLGSGRPLSDEEKTALESEFDSLKGEFDTLEKKVAAEREAEAKLPDVYQNQIQKFITAGREMLSAAGEGQEVLWDKTKQLQVEVYKVIDLVADSTEELKDKLQSLFKSIAEIDVQKIGDAPRNFN